MDNRTLENALKNVRRAPPLPPPKHVTVRVSNTQELVRVLSSAEAGMTIFLADGIYTPPPDLFITMDNVSLRGESGDRERVIIDGGGAFATMLRIKGASDTLIADMTFRNCQHYGIFIFGDSNAQRTRIYNVKFHNIWTRAVKGTHPQRPDDAPEPLHPLEYGMKVRPCGGRIEYCYFLCDTIKPYDDWTGGDYISGIDMMMLKDWTISDNVFAGIRGKTGGGRGAVFIWVRSENVRVERNLIINCDRGICFGNPSGQTPQVTGGIVRQNSIVAGADKAIEICGTVDCEISNNCVYSGNPEFQKTVHVFGGSTGTKVCDNIIHGSLLTDDAVSSVNNHAGQLGPVFVDAVSGDLWLTMEARRKFGANAGRTEF